MRKRFGLDVPSSTVLARTSEASDSGTEGEEATKPEKGFIDLAKRVKRMREKESHINNAGNVGVSIGECASLAGWLIGSP